MTEFECEEFRREIYNDGYQDGLEWGIERGNIDGYQKGSEDTRNELESEHENQLEKEYKHGFNDAESTYSRDIENIQYNMEQTIHSLNSKILDLKRTIYNLRKENAAITRSIQ
ncbi:hypothetical protein [Yersinia phage fHe-Yen9-04]|uniref:Uncharacterized protein n=2 Tax=Eneladusvirus Yen904 TaxID=2560849 RepID=A0A2C9CXF5_9CAUD|nr:hypothetical protein FDJ41_gp214 [Yersinia phage fHe-Yen9-04]SOK58491.1 hypothetical protein [Yersinia phage fHe-Yen9-04]SOK59026.1 hypothetical protein [Yersinia phage fHe-Yen9-03]VUE36260.1 hypothetical protein [Yersinia phage fHe-Yen9-04]